MYKILLLICFPIFVCAQLSEDFSDNNFSNNPAWFGDTAKFIVNVSREVQLNAIPATDNAVLFTTNNRIANTEWQFYIKLDFSPSASNYLKVYLSADSSNLDGPLNGYFLKIGESGSNDDIDLYVQNGLIETLLIDGIDGHAALNSNILNIKILHDDIGNWELYTDTTGNNVFKLEGIGFDSSVKVSNYFGFNCFYTSSRSDKFYFDDIYIGAERIDTIPPTIDSIKIISSTVMDVYFSETIKDTGIAVFNSYIFNPNVTLDSAQLDADYQHLIHIYLSDSLLSGTQYQLIIKGIKDLNNNIMCDTISFDYYEPKVNNIIITEIFADPDPIIGLPIAEYIELYNRSEFEIDLFNWSLSDNTSSVLFPRISIAPNSYIIICASSNMVLFSSYTNVLSLNTFPSLNNSGDELIIRNEKGQQIFYVNYSENWYKDELKKLGGWSLEMKDVNNPCGGEDNWASSINISGGTPGQMNSVIANNLDVVNPQIINVGVIDSLTIFADFSESLDSISTSSMNDFIIENYMGNILSVNINTPENNSLVLKLDLPLSKKEVYQLSIKDVFDCAGNIINSSNRFPFGLSESIDSGGILINEILFNPYSGGFDFLEIYNNSNRLFDLSELRLANLDEDGYLNQVMVASLESKLLFPNQYVVFTENKKDIIIRYYAAYPENIIEVSDMPSFPDKEGNARLLNKTGDVIDAFTYNENMQFAILDEKDGVSLERISFLEATQNRENWHSAATKVGYATPTYQNSQVGDYSINENVISLSPQTFSPDLDGYNDFLQIDYTLEKPGFVATIIVFDDKGRQIKEITNNSLLNQNGFFVWDGTKDDASLADIGIYVVFVELFDLEGNLYGIKKTCVLAKRM